MKIIIGLPSLNEEDSIQKVVETADKALSKLSGIEYLIYNADSGSSDNTVSVFENTQTMGRKESKTLTQKGKGRAIIDILQKSVSYKATHCILLDTDVTSITEDWLLKFITPLQTGVDLVIPVYSRYIHEANTTNHFCYPLISKIYGTTIYQPIAGDFGLSCTLIQKILENKIHESTLRYGIDICITLNALNNDLCISQIELGNKIHKPSFDKMIPMFKDVCESFIINYEIKKYLGRNEYTPPVLPIYSKEKYIQQEKINDRRKASLELAHSFSMELYKEAISLGGGEDVRRFWVNTLKEYVYNADKLKQNIEKFSEKTRVAYLLYVCYFLEISKGRNVDVSWSQIEDLSKSL